MHDGTVASAPDTMTIDTLNSSPIAQAGSDQSTVVGETVTLDGSQSSDADGNPLNYQWSLSNKPLASTALLLNPTTPHREHSGILTLSGAAGDDGQRPA